MVQSYSDVIAKQKEIGSAKILNPNLQTQQNQDQARIDQENKQIIQDYIDSKIKEGYKLNPDGSLSKETRIKTGKQRGKQTYKITTTTINVDQQGQVQTSTQSRSTKTGSSSDPLVAKANKLEQALRDIDSGKSQASPSTRSSLQNQLNQTYELIRNRKGNKSFVTVPSEQVVDGGSVFDITGKGYSVAPVLQDKFIKEKNESIKKDVVIPQNVQSAFTVPRTISGQETSSIPLRIKNSNLPIVASQEFGGVMNVRRVGDFNNRYDDENNLVTPTPIDTAEMNVRNAINKLEINSFVGDLQINPFLKVRDTPLIAVGVVSGVFSASRLGFNVIQASNLNPVTENQLAIQKRLGQGVLDVIKDPFKKLVAEPVETVAKNPLYEGSKLATELVLLEGASRTAKGVLSVNKFSNTDVRISTIENTPSLINPLERKSYFIDEGSQLKGNVPFNVEDSVLSQRSLSGGNVKGKPYSPPTENEFVIQGEQSRLNDVGFKSVDEQIKIREVFLQETKDLQGTIPFKPLGEDLGQSNLQGTIVRSQGVPDFKFKQPEYNEFTIQGDQAKLKSFEELSPKEKARATEIFNEQTGNSFEIKTISKGQKTLDGKNAYNRLTEFDPLEVKDLTESTQQSIKIIDEVTITDQGGLIVTKGLKLKPLDESSAIESTSLRSTDYVGGKDKSIPVDTLGEKVGSNEGMFKTKSLKEQMQEYNNQLVILEEQPRGKTILDQPPAQDNTVRFKISPDIAESNTVKIAIQKGDLASLGKDIQGEITSPKLNVGVLSPVLLQSGSKVNTVQVQPLQIKTDQSSKVSSKINTDQMNILKLNTQVVQVQSPVSIQSPIQSLKQSSTTKLNLKQLQKTQPILKSETAVDTKIKPLLPTVRSERQVKSGAGLFDVLVRKEGKFIKIGSGYSDLATAFNRGKQEIKNTARASFKIVSRLGEVQKVGVGSDRTLRPSKVDPSVIVQKRSFRISSAGEKNEISRKGAFTQRTRRGLRRSVKKGIFI